MAEQQPRRFLFLVPAARQEPLVVRFHGEEGLSRCYRFEVELVAEDGLRPGRVGGAGHVHHPAAEGDVPFHGILAEFSQLQQMENYVFFRAVLVPRMWRLGLTYHNQVFLDQTVPQILEDIPRMPV